jgi:hypothetical protein
MLVLVLELLRRGHWGWASAASSRRAAGSRRCSEYIIMMTSFNSLEKVQHRTRYDPFDAILIPHAERLPDLLLILALACDGDPRATPLLRWVLGDLPKLPSAWFRVRVS